MWYSVQIDILNGRTVEGHFLGHLDLYYLGHHIKSNGIQKFSVSLTVSVLKPQVEYYGTVAALYNKKV